MEYVNIWGYIYIYQVYIMLFESIVDSDYDVLLWITINMDYYSRYY